MPNEAPAPVCPKCGGAMEEGFIIDYGQYMFAAKHVSSWVQGPPKLSWCGALGDETRRRIQSIRCVKCGFLESYATNLTDD